MPVARRAISSAAWVADFRYRIVDLVVRVRCGDDAVASRLAGLLGWFRIESSIRVSDQNTFDLVEHRGAWILTRNESLLAKNENWPPLIPILVAELNALAVANMRCFAVHSGAVVGGDGVVAFPSASGGGKSTMTAACLLAGFAYVSDEALCLDRQDAQVLPYPKPISLDSWSMHALGLSALPETPEETLVSPADLGSVAVREKVPLRHVVLMERGTGGGELSELARSEVFASLLRFAFNHYKRPEQSFRLLAEIAGSCRAWRLRFDEPTEGARMVRDRLYTS